MPKGSRLNRKSSRDYHKEIVDKRVNAAQNAFSTKQVTVGKLAGVLGFPRNHIEYLKHLLRTKGIECDSKRMDFASNLTFKNEKEVETFVKSALMHMPVGLMRELVVKLCKEAGISRDIDVRNIASIVANLAKKGNFEISKREYYDQNNKPVGEIHTLTPENVARFVEAYMNRLKAKS